MGEGDKAGSEGECALLIPYHETTATFVTDYFTDAGRFLFPLATESRADRP